MKLTSTTGNKYSQINGTLSNAIPIVTDVTTINFGDIETAKKESAATTGGLAVDANGDLFFHSRQGKVGLIKPDLNYGGIIPNVVAPTGTQTWGDAASIRGTVGTGDVYREYFIQGTDEVLAGTIGTIVDGKFVPTVKTTTGKDTIEKDQALYKAYDASVGRPQVIKAADGKVYQYVQVREDSDPEKGTVQRDPQVIKYEYAPIEVTGNVVVTYVDVDGNEIKDPVDDEKNVDANTPYNTDEDRKLEVIRKDGKLYELAPEGTYPVGQVDGNNHLVSSDPTTGEVDSGTTHEVTYVYREVKTPEAPKTGDVVLHYVDTKGNELQPNHTMLMTNQ